MKDLQEKKLNLERLDLTSEEEFIRLYKDLHKSLMSYGMRICSNEELTRDGIHEIFLEAWEKNQQFASVKEIKPYLFRCLRNVLIDNFKKQKSFFEKVNGEIAHSNGVISEDSYFSLSQEDVIIERESEDESKRLVGKYISKLSARQKEVFYLKFYDGLTNKEISKVTGIHYQSVRNIISEGIKRIRDANLEFYILLSGLVVDLI